MPLYDYKCGECSHEFELKLSMADYEKPTIEPCPSCTKSGTVTQQFGANAFIDSARLGIKKPDRTFQRDIIGRMKKEIPQNFLGRGHFDIPGRV